MIFILPTSTLLDCCLSRQAVEVNVNICKGSERVDKKIIDNPDGKLFWSNKITLVTRLEKVFFKPDAGGLN